MWNKMFFLQQIKVKFGLFLTKLIIHRNNCLINRFKKNHSFEVLVLMAPLRCMDVE